jgi:hypothetical protein
LALAQGYAEFAMRNIGHVPPALLAESPSGLSCFAASNLGSNHPTTARLAKSFAEELPMLIGIPPNPNGPRQRDPAYTSARGTLPY